MRWLALVLVSGWTGCGGSHSNPVDGAGSGAIDAPGTGADSSGSGNPDGSVGSCPSGMWCVETAPSGQTRLAGVWALDAGDVFAVGDGGTIIRRDASATWSTMTSNVTANLRAVYVHDASHAWAVGDGGTIDVWNGSTWTPTTGVTTSDLAGVWGASASDVWAVGPSTALHWNGSTWTNSGLGGVLLSVSGNSGSDVWACGETAYVRHYTGTWSSPISPVTGDNTYYAIAAAGTSVWVTSATSGSESLLWNGSTWTPHATGGVVFEALYAHAGNDVWGTAQKNVGHWNGTAWDVAQPAGVTGSLWAVAGVGADVFVVGDGGKILHRD